MTLFETTCVSRSYVYLRPVYFTDNPFTGISVAVTKRRERDQAIADLRSERERADATVSSLHDLKRSHEFELKKAQAKAMREFQELLEQHPMLVQQNQEQQEVIENQKHELASLKRALQGRVAEKEVDREVKEVRGTKKAAKVARAFQAGLQEAQEEKVRQEKQSREQGDSRSDRVSKNYSAHAARVSRFAVKAASKPKSAMEILDTASRRKSGKSSATYDKGHSRPAAAEESHGSENPVLAGMSLNVSSAKKRRRVETSKQSVRHNGRVPTMPTLNTASRNADIRTLFRTK